MIVRGFVTAAVLGLAFVQTAVAQTTAPLTAQTAGAARDELETLSPRGARGGPDAQYGVGTKLIFSTGGRR